MLDNNLKAFDTAGMYQNILALPEQIRRGVAIGQNVDLKALRSANFQNIVLAGMGGSAIGGDLTRTLLRGQLAIPFEIHRNYGLPSYAAPGTLLICSSYSGSTEETLAAFAEARNRKCHIFCITTGGELGKLAAELNVPAAIIPPGLPPRAALGFSFTPTLVVLGRLGLCRDYSEELLDAANLLQEQNRAYQYESGDNFPLAFAQSLIGKIPMIYAGADLLDTVALRFKGQICENAKQLAFCNVFPEFNHNELVGWQLPPNLGEHFKVVIFRDRDDHPQTIRRMEIVGEILRGKNVEVAVLEGIGKTALARMLSLIHLGDFISLYLALLNKVDPTPIEVINYLKRKLTEN
jgi:glucose/mannose-6-phosphate isomerase